MNKKRISPTFDLTNIEHKKAVKYLENKGRNKADYIASAVLFYENNKNILKNDSRYVTRDEVNELIKNALANLNNKRTVENNAEGDTDLAEDEKITILGALKNFC